MTGKSRRVKLGEFDVIATYFRPLAGPGALDLIDDAAVFSPPAGQDIVLSADAVAAGVHFLADDPADLVARKALRVNLSDLAAKGATPAGYLLTLALPTPFDGDWLAAFAAGLAADQAAYGVTLCGGDTIRVPTGVAGPLVAITAFGSVPAGSMVRRDGGNAGDRLVLSGTVGGAAAGLACLTGAAGPLGALTGNSRAAAIDRYRLPRPRLALAAALRAHATAAIDVSDGLVGDCDKLAAASGCLAAIDAGLVPLDTALAARTGRRDTVAAALTGGDDFEILAAVPPMQIAAFSEAAAETGIQTCEIGALTEARAQVGRRAQAEPAAQAGGGAHEPEPTTVTLHGRRLELRNRAHDHSGTGTDNRPAN